MPETTDMGGIALDYATELDWRVLRIGLNKIPNVGKDWRSKATTDGHIISQWWDGHHSADGIGVLTGADSGFWVLDVDVANGKQGAETLRALQAEHGKLPVTPTAITGSGGLHFLFRWDPSRPVTNGMATRLGPGLDIRGEGGQIVVSPSTHPSGTQYRWKEGRSPWTTEMAEAPEWLYQLLESTAPPPISPSVHATNGSEVTPADWVRTRYRWDELLGQDGWVFHHEDSDGVHWTRPGKDKRDGSSAVTHGEDGPLVVFSTEVSAELWRVGKPTFDGGAVSVTKFNYIVASRYDGDASTAAREIRAEMPDDRPVSTEHTAEVDDDGDEGGPPTSFLDKGGLKIVNLGRHVLAQGPLRPAPDGRMWAYVNGVWVPDTKDRITRSRVATALGQKYRSSHGSNVVEWLAIQEGPEIDPGRPPDYSTINCRSGLLDWQTAELRPHDPNHLSTVQLSVEWDPEAQCPAIDTFLATVLDNDQSMIDFFFEIAGYMCASGNPLHVAVLLLGGGRNGKGSALRLIEALVGPKNVANVTPHQMAENRFAASELYGRLANIAGDLDARLIERTDLFKMITGGDSIVGERKYADAFSFRPWATPMFSANEAPAVRDHSEGFYSRWVVIPFDVVIPEAERLPEHVLDAQLHRPTEMRGMFAKSILGLQRLMERGRFELPAPAAKATRQFRIDTDPVAAFVDDELVLFVDGWEPSAVLVSRYKSWCLDNGRMPLSAQRFRRALKQQLGFHPNAPDVKRMGTRGIPGIRLR